MGKKDKKETAADAAAARAEFFKNTRMNLDEAFVRIQAKKAGIDFGTNSGGKSSLIDKDVSTVDGQQVANEHMNWDAMLAGINKLPQPKQQQRFASANNTFNPFAGNRPNTISISLKDRVTEAFQPAVAELARFKLASTASRREEQLRSVMAAVADARQKVAIQEVCQNTKALFSNATRFRRLRDGTDTLTGLVVTYKIANTHVNVTVEGEFLGDEIVALESSGEGATAEVTATVARQVGDEFEDISSNYAMKLAAAE